MYNRVILRFLRSRFLFRHRWRLRVERRWCESVRLRIAVELGRLARPSVAIAVLQRPRAFSVLVQRVEVLNVRLDVLIFLSELTEVGQGRGILGGGAV